jgi:cell division initiation protein
MITPLDIQNQEFTRGVRGYKPEEVDTFLDLITTDMERLIEENNNLKEQVRALSAELERYRSTEGMVLDTLEAAKALMGDISASAEKRAEILLKNAELDKALLESELERFDTLSKELFDDKGMEDLKSILESKTENLSYERKDDREEGVDFTDKTIFNFRAGSEK